jgi:tetratricopeptide (TPR) repeat protein
MYAYRKEALAALVLVAATFAAFYPICSNKFEFINLDDSLYVTANPHVQAGLTLRGLVWNFTNSYSNHWHPLTWLSLQIDYELCGLQPRGYHLTNLALHIGSTLLLFVFLRVTTGSIWRSAIVAVVFAVHPLRAEAVAWIAERKGVLSTFFWMLTLLAYAHYVRKPSIARYFLVLLAFTLGLLSKPMLVTLPFVLLLLDYWPLGRLGQASPSHVSWRRVLVEKAPLLVVAGACSVVFVAAQRRMLMSVEAYSLGIRLENAIVAYARYLLHFFWPANLALEYPHPGHTLTLAEIATSALVLVVVSAAVIRRAKTQAYLLVGWLWFLGTLLPVIGLVQLSDFALADRFSYVPSVGLLLLVTWGVADLAARFQRQESVALATGLLLLVAVAATWLQVHYWQNSLMVWERSLAVSPVNPTAQKGLGTAFFQRGELDKAETHLTDALRLRPNDPEAQYNLGLVRLQQGKEGEGIRCFRAALQIDPASVDALNGLGFVLLQKGQLDDAHACFARVLAIDPENPFAREQIANCRPKGTSSRSVGPRKRRSQTGTSVR